LLRWKKSFLWASAISVALIAAFLLSIFIPGWLLGAKARGGDPAAQYAYARWTENHCEDIGRIIIWPCDPDVLGGFAWLEQAAAQDHPPAVWLVGVRLKYGIHVPEPAGWSGPGGNVFPQPDRGQAMIERALNELGFNPPTDEDRHYWQAYRR
jgi:hypothetical protein